MSQPSFVAPHGAGARSRIAPDWSTAWQYCPTQLTASKLLVPSMSLTAHVALAPSVGSVDSATLPKSSTAAQYDVVHETAFSGSPWLTLVEVHAARPPVGAVDVRTSPIASTATHSEVVGQEMPSIGSP